MSKFKGLEYLVIMVFCGMKLATKDYEKVILKTTRLFKIIESNWGRTTQVREITCLVILCSCKKQILWYISVSSILLICAHIHCKGTILIRFNLGIHNKIPLSDLMQPKCLEDLAFRSWLLNLFFFFASPIIKRDTYSIEMHNLWEHMKRTHFPSKSVKFNLAMED